MTATKVEVYPTKLLNIPVATISDDVTPVGSLTVQATGMPTGMSLSVTTGGGSTVTAHITANASVTKGVDYVITVTVTDGRSQTDAGTFIVRVLDPTAARNWEMNQ